jgi:hypothetical protein
VHLGADVCGCVGGLGGWGGTCVSRRWLAWSSEAADALRCAASVYLEACGSCNQQDSVLIQLAAELAGGGIPAAPAAAAPLLLLGCMLMKTWLGIDDQPGHLVASAT